MKTIISCVCIIQNGRHLSSAILYGRQLKSSTEFCMIREVLFNSSEPQIFDFNSREPCMTPPPPLSDPLKKSYFATRELLLFYITCIRSILEYGSPVFHRTLPSYLSKDLERLQKHAMKIIYPELSYAKALEYKAVSGSKFSF